MDVTLRTNLGKSNVSGFLSKIESEYDLPGNNTMSVQSNIYDIDYNFLNFDEILNAPEFVPSTKPICIYKILSSTRIEEEEEVNEDSDMFNVSTKANLIGLLQKYGKQDGNSRLEVKNETENEDDLLKNDFKIPEIGN